MLIPGKLTNFIVNFSTEVVVLISVAEIFNELLAIHKKLLIYVSHVTENVIIQKNYK